MKQLIMHMASILVIRNGNTTTKEVKDALHEVFSSDPTFSLTQKEVSAAMAELYVENNWDRELLQPAGANVAFYQYSFVTDGITPLVPASTNQQPSAQVAPGITPSANGANTATVATHAQTVTQPQVYTGLDPKNGTFVAYISGKFGSFEQANDRNDAKKKVFKNNNASNPGLIYDKINSCTVEFFNKHHFSKIV